MNGSDILIALDVLSRTSCRDSKLGELAVLLDDPLFALISRLTCDPFITFGLKAPLAPSCGCREITGTNDPIFELLAALQHRKLTGAIARSVLHAAHTELAAAPGELLRRILSRNLGCGIGGESLNSVRAAHVPSMSVMLASKFEAKLFSSNKRYVAEPKKDGVRAICLIMRDSAQFITRNGRHLRALDDLARSVLCFAQEAYKNALLSSDYGDGFAPLLVLDGEVLSGNLAETVSDVLQKRRSSTDAKFEVFDIIPHAMLVTEACVRIPFIKRRQALEQMFAHAPTFERLSLVEQRPVGSVAECYDLGNEWEQQGFEGAMIKDLDAPYQRGRSQAWLKLKRHETDDGIVTGMFEGTGRHAGKLGGVICDFSGTAVRVGSGFSDRVRQDLWQQRHHLVGRMVEVAFQELTANCSLRHPRFIRFRDDKCSAPL